MYRSPQRCAGRSPDPQVQVGDSELEERQAQKGHLSEPTTCNGVHQMHPCPQMSRMGRLVFSVSVIRNFISCRSMGS